MTTYKVLNPHPKVISAWEKAGYIPSDLDAKTREQVFFQQISNKPTYKTVTFGHAPNERRVTFVAETVEDSGRPVTRQVTKMYRTQDGKVFYNEFLEGQHFQTTDPLTHTRIVGKYDAPTFRVQQSKETGDIMDVTVRDKKPVFEIELTEGKFTDPSTEKETTLEELHKLASSDFTFYVKTSNRKFALHGITLEDFINKPFQELVHYGEKGNWPAAEVPKKRTKSDE